MVRMRHTPTLMRHRCGVGSQLDWLSFSGLSCEVGTKFKTCPIRNIYVCVRKGFRPPHVTFNTNISFLPLLLTYSFEVDQQAGSVSTMSSSVTTVSAVTHIATVLGRTRNVWKLDNNVHSTSISCLLFGLCGRLILVSFRSRQLLQKTSFSGIFWTSKFRPPLYLRKMEMLTKRPRTFTPQTCYRAKLRHSKINWLQSG